MKNMKLILTSLLCLLFTLAVVAQDDKSIEMATSDLAQSQTNSNDCDKEETCSYKKVRTGVKLSLGNSRAVVNRDAGAFSKELSWEGGVYLRYNINRKLYIQPEAIYHHQKYSRTTDLNSFTYTHNQARGQLLGGIKPIGLGIYFNAGLYYAYQIGGKLETSGNGNTTEETFSDFPVQNDETEPFNTTDFGYILGGTLSLNGGGFAMSVLFSRSFDSVLNDEYHVGDAAFENLSLRHRSVHFVIQKKF